MIVEFITENAIYVGLALASGIALLWPALSHRGIAGVQNVTPNEAVLLMNRAKTLILDIRDEAEYTEGHIQGAKHIPLAELETRIKEIEKHKNKPVLVNCRKGMRTNKACQLLTQHAFTQLYQLEGGLDKWKEAKMPLVKD